MEAIDRQLNSVKTRGGSALILVIVLTVLLALIGAMFILMSRIDEMSTQSIKYDRQLDAAVDTLVDKISEELAWDIHAGGTSRLSSNNNAINEVWDYPKHNIDPGKDGILGTLDDHANQSFGRDSDPWLASLNPEMIDMSVDMGTLTPSGLPVIDRGFRHITDLYGQLAVRYDWSYDDYLSLGHFDERVDAEGDRWSMRNLRAIILDPDMPTRYGNKADADGDGVADSRWISIPGMVTEKGEGIYAALRIIDNGGMINVNTACRRPDDVTRMTVPGNWDGSQLSHVNLEGSYISGTDIGDSLDASFMLASRYGTVTSTPGAADFYDYLSDLEYEANAGRRLNDPMIVAPDEMFLPFDIGDELELRNRFFLSTSFKKNGTVIRPALALPATLNPQADPGKGLPVGSNSSDPDDTFDAWYDKVGPDAMGSSNRRHYSTTVSRDVIYRTNTSSLYLSSSDATPLNPEQKIGVTLPLDIQNGSAGPGAVETHVKRLAMGIYRCLPIGFWTVQRRFGFGYDSEKLAWQMAVNMVDYQDDKIDYTGPSPADAPEEPTKIKIGDTTYFGTEDLETLKKNTVCISKIGYRDRSSGPVPSLYGKYYGIEVFNPDDDTADGAKVLSDYKIIITDSTGNYKGEFDLSGNIEHSGSSDGTDDTLAFLFNDSGRSLNISASSLNAIETRSVLVNPTPVLSFIAGDKIILVNNTYDMPVDCVQVPSDMKTNQSNVPADVRFRRTKLPGTHFLLPALYPSISPWEASTGAFGERLGDVIDPTRDGSTPKAELIEPAESTDPKIQELEFVGVQFEVPNRQLSNLGEIENVFAVGTRYKFNDSGNADKTDDIYQCTTLIQGIVASIVTITGAGTGSYDHQLDCEAFDPADPDTGIDMKSFGRIRLTDSIYSPLLDSLTYFDQARDGVDLHNIAEEKTVTASGPILDPVSKAYLDTITDGLFLPKDNLWDDGTVYWTDPDTAIEIDLGTSQEIWGAIVQADYNDEYVLQYWDGTTWQLLMPVFNNDPFGLLMSGGLQTRPDAYDDGLWQLLDEPVTASKIRIIAGDADDDGTITTDNQFSISEIQLGINIGPYAPHYYDNAIAGRININTAPWYVINQLPWIEDNTPVDTTVSHGALAQAIVAFRDKAATPGGEVSYSDFIDPATSLLVEGRGFTTGIDPADISEDAGFTDIAQLMQVINKDSDPAASPPLVDFDIRKNIFDDADAIEGDYTPDMVKDDFEERNLLFHRISNLVTVRSDVFTAYILVRAGSRGPQRRMIAVFDRSEVKSVYDKPKLLAIHPVPDPR